MLLLSIPLRAVEQYFHVPPSANDFDVRVLNRQVLMQSVPETLCVLRHLHRQLLRFSSPSLLSFPFHLGSFSFAAHGLRLEVSAAGVGSVKSPVTHLVVTIYCIFYLFSVTVLLIYRMVQMFWHNYFGLHYLFMMLFFFFCHCLLYIWNDKWCTC